MAWLSFLLFIWFSLRYCAKKKCAAKSFLRIYISTNFFVLINFNHKISLYIVHSITDCFFGSCCEHSLIIIFLSFIKITSNFRTIEIKGNGNYLKINNNDNSCRTKYQANNKKSHTLVSIYKMNKFKLNNRSKSKT